jgi:hypothetical protein
VLLTGPCGKPVGERVKDVTGWSGPSEAEPACGPGEWRAQAGRGELRESVTERP